MLEGEGPPTSASRNLSCEAPLAACVLRHWCGCPVTALSQRAILMLGCADPRPAIIGAGLRGGRSQCGCGSQSLFLLLLLPTALHAQAEKRVALVIGNSDYQHTSRLANPKNDATEMAVALRKLGFQVLEGFNLDKPSFDRKVRDFATALRSAEAGVFFYAGHGLQVAGQNYLVPIDAELSTVSALDFEMVKLDLVHRTMEREAQTNILFLDACGDNPLARNLARAIGTRSTDIGRGLAAVESGVGTLISFSTQPGNVALDGTGRNSPFAKALVKYASSSSDDLSAILIAVRNDVMKETQRKQVPWEHSALTGRFYFNGTIPTAPAPLRPNEAAEAWDRTKDLPSVPAFEVFIRRFGDTYYGDLAKMRLAELKQAGLATKADDAVVKKAEEDACAKAEAVRQRLALLQLEQERERVEAARKRSDVSSAAEHTRITTKERRDAGNAADTSKFAALSPHEQSTGSRQFDGAWTITRHRKSTCPRLGSYPPPHSVKIEGGAIGGGAASGSVSASGAVRWTESSPHTSTLHYSGTLRGNSGSANAIDGAQGWPTACRNRRQPEICGFASCWQGGRQIS